MNNRPRGKIIEIDPAVGFVRIQIEDGNKVFNGMVDMTTTDGSVVPRFRKHDIVDFDIETSRHGEVAINISNVTLIDAVEERVLEEYGEFPRGDGGLREKNSETDGPLGRIP